jgi:hypothetical protein
MLIPTPKDIRNTTERIKNIPAFIPKSAKNGTAGSLAQFRKMPALRRGPEGLLLQKVYFLRQAKGLLIVSKCRKEDCK